MMTMEAQGKGIAGLLHRATLLPTRYGLGPERIQARLQRMQATLERSEVTPTIPVSAVALERHPGISQVLRTVDVAVHGYRHVDYTTLTPAEQADDLDTALRIFRGQGFNPNGFRGPYLRASRDTMSLLVSRGVIFDSSRPRLLLPRNDPAGRLAATYVPQRYGPIPEGPALPAGSVPLGIPVALPDDEILVDAMGLRTPATLWRIYESMLAAVRREGSLIVLMVHPERFGIMSDAVELFLERATDDGAWKPSLAELARWAIREGPGATKWPHGCAYSVAVTGDLDAVSLTDFAWRSIGR